MPLKAPDGTGNVRCHSIWLFPDCYTFGYLFVFLTRNCQFVILSPTKQEQKVLLTLEGWGRGWGGGVGLRRGFTSYDIETFRSCPFIPSRNFDI